MHGVGELVHEARGTTICPSQSAGDFVPSGPDQAIASPAGRLRGRAHPVWQSEARPGCWPARALFSLSAHPHQVKRAARGPALRPRTADTTDRPRSGRPATRATPPSPLRRHHAQRASPSPPKHQHLSHRAVVAAAVPTRRVSPAALPRARAWETRCPSAWRSAVRRSGDQLSVYEEILLSLDTAARQCR